MELFIKLFGDLLALEAFARNHHIPIKWPEKGVR